MNKDDVIKFIDGKVFYYSDYINFLYQQLELKDNIIKEAREFIKEMPSDEYIGYWKKEIFEILDKESK